MWGFFRINFIRILILVNSFRNKFLTVEGFTNNNFELLVLNKTQPDNSYHNFQFNTDGFQILAQGWEHICLDSIYILYIIK